MPSNFHQQAIEPETLHDSPPLSKRAARRLIQRAWVLVGRERHVREHIRAANSITLWVLEDWKFSWTVVLDRGKIHFERRPAKKPDLTLTWPTAAGFFTQIENGGPAEPGFEMTGNTELRRLLEPICRAYCETLRGVLQNPIDEVGESLL